MCFILVLNYLFQFYNSAVIFIQKWSKLLCQAKRDVFVTLKFQDLEESWKLLICWFFNLYVAIVRLISITSYLQQSQRLPGWHSGNPLAKEDTQEMQVQSLGGKITWRRKCQHTSLLSTEHSHGVEPDSPCGCKKLDMMSTHTHTHSRAK